jgi:hypothetical protein
MSKTKEVSKVLNPELVAIEKQASSLLKKWASPIVKTAEQFEAAALGAKDFVAIRKNLKAKIKPEVDAAKADYDAKRKAYNLVDGMIAQGEEAIRLELEAYNDRHAKAAEAKIEKALASGNDTKAAAIAAKPYIPQTEGLSFTERWHAEVVDIAVLLSAVLDGRVSQEAIEPNLVYLNTQARATKKEDIGIPGVKGVKETSSSIRG